jgi:hypothetical protein
MAPAYNALIGLLLADLVHPVLGLMPLAVRCPIVPVAYFRLAALAQQWSKRCIGV